MKNDLKKNPGASILKSLSNYPSGEAAMQIYEEFTIEIDDD